MKKSPEKTFYDKVKETSAFLWAIRLMFIAVLGGGGVFVTYAKEFAGWLAKDTIMDVVSDSVAVQRQVNNKMHELTKQQLDNILVLWMEADPRFKEAVLKKAEKEKTNEALLNAIKGDK